MCKKLSDERASNWTDTLESKRRSKLRWKQEVLDREEAKRKEIDKKEAVIQNKIRQQTIKRAKALQYEENERVRILRSQQLYTDVIETRQEQVKEKEQQEEEFKKEERQWHEQTVVSIESAKERDEKKQAMNKYKAIENARAMAAQKVASETRFRNLQSQRMEEEKALIKSVELENEKSRNTAMARKTEAREKAKSNMKRLALDANKKEEERIKLELAEEEKRIKDISRSSFVAKARADLEVKHFEQRQAARKLLSDKASKELQSRSAKEVEIFIRDQKAIENKGRARKEEEARKALLLETVVDESRKQQIELKEQNRVKQLGEDAAFIQQSTKQCLQELACEKKKEAERRNRNLMYKKLQEEQILERKQRESTSVQAKLEEERKVGYHFLRFMLQSFLFVSGTFTSQRHVITHTSFFNMQVAEKFAKEDDLFQEFAMKEMERFRSEGKSTNLIRKVLTTKK